MYIPFNYENINLQNGFNIPSTNYANSAVYNYWERALFQRAAYVLDFDLGENLSGDIKDFFTWCMFAYGYVGFFDSPETGFAFQPGCATGFDFYYRPTDFIISNPLYSKEFKIGKDCEIVKLTPDYRGIWDIISFYAEKLSNLSLSVDMSIINTRFARILGARNKAAAEALKKVLDKINSGQPAVIYDKLLMDDKTDKASPFQDFQATALKDGYITDLQLRDVQTILNMFDCEIGISTIPYQKKERLVVSEAESKTVESQARVTVWLETLNGGFDAVNRHFGTNLSVKLRKEVDDYVSE